MIAVFIFIILLIYSLYNKERGLIYSAVLSPALLSISIYEIGTVFFCLSIVFLFLFKDQIKSINLGIMPFGLVIVITIFMYLISGFVAQEKHYYSLFRSLIEFSVFPLCCWIVFTKNNRFGDFVNILINASFLIIGYTFIETILKDNPYVHLCVAEDCFGGKFIEGVRFGFRRCQAFFSYHETLGAYCMTNIGFYVCLLYIENLDKFLRTKIIWVIGLLTVCVFLTGSRSSILATVVALLPIFFAKKKYLLLVPVIFCVVYFAMPEYFSEILSSMTNTDSVDGSNSEMRNTQLEVSFYYLMRANNIFVGNGFSFADSNVVGIDSAIAGAESIWFRIIMDQGIMGIICTAYFFIYSIYRSAKVHWLFLFFPLAYLVARTVAVVPTMTLSYIIPYIMFLVLLEKYNVKLKTK